MGTKIIESYEQLQSENKELKEENKEKQELIDGLCSQEPCPKCGYGVTGACYGCEIKRLKAENKMLKNMPKETR